MLLHPVLFGLFSLMFISIILNVFGIYCLRKQKGGNVNQRMLLQNLSFIEITKMTYDYIPMTLYHFHNDWYKSHFAYLDIIEINLTTILFSSVLLISMDRFACVLLRVRYNHYIKEPLVRDILVTTWVAGFTSGLFMWALASSIEYAKVYYYMTFDVIIIIWSGITYLTMIKFLRKRNERFRQLAGNGNGHMKCLRMFLVPSVIITSFILFNAIPDIIMANDVTEVTYHVTSYLWTLGFVTDPLIYIFLNKKSRRIAIASFKCRTRICWNWQKNLLDIENRGDVLTVK